MTEAWQYWAPGLGGMPPGATELRDVPGVGPRHFHAHPDGAVLVFGEAGLGAIHAKPDAASALLQAYAQALASASSSGCTPPQDPTVLPFQRQWNLEFDPTIAPFQGFTALSESGTYDAPTMAALGAMGFNAVAPCAAGGGGGPPYPDPGTCPAGSVWNSTTGQCIVAPGGGGTPQAQSTTSAGTVALIVLGVAAAGAVAYAALRPPSPHELAAASKAHAHRAKLHAYKANALRSAVRSRRAAA